MTFPGTSLGWHDVRFGCDRHDDRNMSNNYQSDSSYFIDSSYVIGLSARLVPVMLAEGSSGIEHCPIANRIDGNTFRTDQLFIDDVRRLHCP